MTIDATKYPALAKMEDSKNEGSQAIGAFIEWLGEQGLTICELRSDPGRANYVPHYRSIEQRLADYFEIDLKQVDREQRTILAELDAADVQV